MPLRSGLLASLVALIWGVNFVIIDAGLADVPPLLFAALRFAAVVLPAAFFVPRPAVPFSQVATVGVFMSLGQFGLLYTALSAGMPPGLAALVLQAQVLLTVAIAAIALQERPSGRQTSGMLVGAVGLTVVGAGRAEATPVIGLVLTLAAALSWAMGNVAARHTGPTSGLSMTVWSATVAPVPLLLLSLFVDGPEAVGQALAGLSLAAVASTLFTAYVSSLVGYGIWNTLLARFPAASVVPFALLVPPVGLTAAWLVRDEAPNAAEAGGGLLLVLGVLITMPLGRRQRPVPPAVDPPIWNPGANPVVEVLGGPAPSSIVPVHELQGFSGMHGGLITALLAMSMQRLDPERELISATATLHRALRGPEPVDLTAAIQRRGHSLTTCVAEASILGEVHVSATAILGTPAEPVIPAPSRPAPEVPRPEECEVFAVPAEFVPVAAHNEFRVIGANRPYAGGDDPTLLAWVRFTGEETVLEPAHVIFLMDALAPSFSAVMPTLAPIPTIEWSVQLIGRPCSWWLLLEASTVAGRPDGWIVEHLTAWDESGRQVATAVQTRKVMTPRH